MQTLNPQTCVRDACRYWNTFLSYLGKARSGSLSVVRRAQQRRLLWQVGLALRSARVTVDQRLGIVSHAARIVHALYAVTLMSCQVTLANAILCSHAVVCVHRRALSGDGSRGRRVLRSFPSAPAPRRSTKAFRRQQLESTDKSHFSQRHTDLRQDWIATALQFVLDMP